MIPKVSIIIPTFNRSMFLSRAVNSVLHQTSHDFELIIIDDASTDFTAQVSSGFADERIKYIRHTHNQGGAVARNTGLKVAQGQYICFLDDDDELLPMKLERQLAQFQLAGPHIGVLYCGWQYIFNSRIIKLYKPHLKGDVFPQMLAHCFTVTNALLIKAECFKKSGYFDTTLKGCQDWDMWIRIAKHYAFDYVEDILVNCHIHGQQISAKLADKIEARSIILSKYLSDLAITPKAYSVQLGRLGVLCCLKGDIRIGVGYILKGIRHNFLNWKNYVYIILLFLDFFKKGTLRSFVTEKHGDFTLFY